MGLRLQTKPQTERNGYAQAGFALALATVVSCGIPLEAAASASATSKLGMVVTEQHLASDVGARVLAAGGNAVDAAVAVGYALAVVDPCCGNLGGGGFMTIRLANGTQTVIDFRERAPLAATRDMYLDAAGNVRPDASTVGYLSVAVPGTVAGLEHARAAFGTFERAELIAPAIALARKGFVLAAGDVAPLTDARDLLARDPEAARLFLVRGATHRVGDRLRQTDLARTLLRIAMNGPDAFYRGPIADAIVAASAAHGGILAKRDFTSYAAKERAPVRCRYRGYEVESAPPPSSGGTTLCEMLNVLEGYPLGAFGFHSVAALRVAIEAERRAYADRNAYLGDPDFVANPVERLLDPAYAARLRATIGERATPSSEIHPGLAAAHEGTSTTHYSVVDKSGNAVAVTYTINSWFGAGVVAPGTGFLLNDEMDDFTSKPGTPNLYGLVQGTANAIAPGKRPLSSMSPTIVTKNGRLFLIAGTPGGSTIITTTLGVLQNVVDYGMDVQRAVSARRVHEQWLPEPVALESGAISKDTRKRLSALGYTFRTAQSEWGVVEAVLVDRDGTMHGASDSRGPGGAAVAPRATR